MSRVSEFLVARFKEAFPDFDTEDPLFESRVLAPLRAYVGENQVHTDLSKLLQDRIGQINPSWQGSVIVDLLVTHVAALLRPLEVELAAANSRRRLDDPSLLSPTDLQELRDVFLVDPEQGGFSVGVFRAYYSVPRSVVVDSTNLLTVQTPRGTLSFRPTRPVAVDGAVMQGQREGSQYYFDFEARATAPGSSHNLAPREANAQGIPSAVRVTNPDRVSGGQDASTPATLLEAIRSAVVNRTPSSTAGLSYHLLLNAPGQNFTLVQSGDPRMLRDRVYGPTHLSGIPGGFSRNWSQSGLDVVASTNSVGIGLAFDVYLKQPPGSGIETQELRALLDEGLLLHDSAIVYFADQLDPIEGNSLPPGQARVRSTRRDFGQLVADPELYGWPFGYRFTPLPAVAGDRMRLQGFFDSFTGIRDNFEIVSNGYGMLRYGHEQVVYYEDDDLLVSLITQRTRLRAQFLRVNLDPTDNTRPRTCTSILPYTCVPCLAAPLRYALARSSNGTSLRKEGYPVLCQPGTAIPEVSAGDYIPRTYNYFIQDSPKPMGWIDRAELLHALTQQPFESGQKVYAYPTQPLFAEFLEPRLGESSGNGTAPIRVRIHLLGPQGMCLTPSCSIGPRNVQYEDSGTGNPIALEMPGNPVLGYDVQKNCGPYRPLAWPQVSYTVTDLEPLAAQSNRIVLSGPGSSTYLTDPLKDFSDRDVYEVYGPRTVRPGDWVVMRPSTYTDPVSLEDPSGFPETPWGQPFDAWQKGVRAFPIKEISNNTTMILEASDLPAGETGVLWVMQGTSRAVQLIEDELNLGLGQDSSPLVRGGRNAEGTFSFDVLVSLVDPDVTPLGNEPPPYNTSASLDMAHTHTQGFCLCNPKPGENFGPYEVPTLLWPTSYLAGHALASRAVRLHGAKGADILDQQAELESGGVRPILSTGQIKRAPRTQVVMALYYDAFDLSAKDAASALESRFYELRLQGKIEIADFVSALYDLGADYVSTGRAFTLTQKHDRGYDYQASRSGLFIEELSEILPYALVVRRLNRDLRAQLGRNFDELSPSNWTESYVARYGGFTED